MRRDDIADQLAIDIECKEDLLFYSRYMFKSQKKYKWLLNWHHKKVSDALMKVYRGETNRLIINIPPRYSKTQMAVVDFISWCFGQHPDCEFIHISYSDTLATNNSYQTRNRLIEPAYRQLFPNTILSPDSKSRGEWRTTAGGVMYATGSQGTITGYGAGKVRPGFAGGIILDDPSKPDEVTSDIMRRKVIDNFQQTIESRLNKPETPIIIIMQRLHEEDLSGWLLAGGNGEKWEHLCIPAINDDGEALWPEKHDIDKLREMERQKPWVFAGQYMQRPAPKGGGIFKTDWWKYYNPNAKPRFNRVIQSWDTALKTKEINDYSCCTTWGETDTGYYLIDIWMGKIEAPDLERTAIMLANKHSPQAVLIEDKASGIGLIQSLRQQTRLPVVPIEPKGDKVLRANEVSPIIESGRVFLPEGAGEVPRYVLSLSQFPNGLHDDDVDSTTQALKYMARGNTMQSVGIAGF